MHARLDAAWHQQYARAHQDDHHETHGQHQGRARLPAQGGGHCVRQLNKGDEEQDQQVEPSVVENPHHADGVVDVEELHEDRYQCQRQQAVDAPSQEVIGRSPVSPFCQHQFTDTLDQEHVPSPEIHQVQFVLKPFRQHESELQDGAYNHAQGRNIRQKSHHLDGVFDAGSHIIVMKDGILLWPYSLHISWLLIN